jgi:hypothetical protein
LTERIHLWSSCHACGAAPIVGPRFECVSCPAGPGNDLCEPCFGGYEKGTVAHPAPGSYTAHIDVGPHVFRSIEGLAPDRYEPWLAVARPQTGDAPRVPDRFVVRPEFRTARDSYFGAHAFVVDAGGAAPLVMTALHVMDELIKAAGIDCTPRNLAYSGEEVPRVVTEVGLYDLFAPNWMFAELGSAGSMLVLPEARVGEDEPYSDRDLAAFRTGPPARVTPGRLAAASPNVGEPVWLASHRKGISARTIEAVVVEATERTLIFRYTDPNDVAPFSSGAPLLDRDGAVAGVNVGAGFFAGQRFGHANHAASIRRHLATGGLQ